MSAFFFGPAEQQLFGCYHAPRGDSRGAVVICPSWGPEYQYAHRALRVLARRLSERGFHVLRFDYSGTGDSWGDTTDAKVDQWQSDVALAIDEIRGMSAQQTVSLIGLRVGALVASAAARRRRDIDRIVMWDPIVDGPRWVRDLNAQREYRNVPGGAAVEFGQRVVSPGLVEYFRSIGPATYQLAAVDTLLLHTESGTAGDPHPLSTAPEITYRLVDDAAPWQADTSIWTGLVPAKAVGSIVDWMTA